MSDVGRGLPLLSGPPPPPPDVPGGEIACRKCNKEFNVIFARARKCNHCGFSYCHSCSDYQALMPRSGEATGYDAMHVCAFCIEYLTITAAGRNQLKAMSLGKLKRYLNGYNIGTDRAVEKDDLIDAIIMARGANGCVSRANENFYRKYSVPNKAVPGRPRGLFSRPGQSSNQPPPPPPRPPTGPVHEFPRPDLAPDHPPPPQAYPPPPTYPPQPPPRPPQQQHYSPPPHPPPRPHSAYSNAPPHNPPPQFHTPPPRPPPGMDQQYGHGYGGYDPRNYPGPQAQAPPPPPHHSRPNPQRSPRQNQSTRPQPARPATQRPQASQPPVPPPRPRAASTAPPPNLNQLVNMSQESIASLSISALKSILFTNHVNAGQILEKSDLVKKVMTLVEDEKAERERQRQAEEREELELMQREEERREAVRQRALERERAEREAADAVASSASTQEESGGDQAHPDGSGENPVLNSEDTRSGTSPVPSSPPRSTVTPPKTKGSATTLERTGLCVVCQDEEANIAIVDCGHMAMCRGCSDLIMGSSRECPLCRTRIVTEARLLRIYRT